MGKRGILRNIMKIMMPIGLVNKDDFNLSIVIYSIFLEWPLKMASLPLGQISAKFCHFLTVNWLPYKSTIHQRVR
jgi:hypothetical protein